MRHSFILVAAVICSLPVCAFSQEALSEKPPGREVSLPRSEVRDAFFAYVLGIIISAIDLDVDNRQMREILTEFKPNLNLPFDLIVRVRQSTDLSNGVRIIRLDFQHDVKIPVPFSLLFFYHPGSIVCSQNLLFTVTRSISEDLAAPGIVFDLALTTGSVLVTIDGWLKVLLSAHHLEDTWIHHIVFFRWRGEWIGLLQGAGGTGREHRSYFNFTRNAIMFPVPNELEATGRGFVAGAAK